MVRKLKVSDLQKIIEYCIKEGIEYVDVSIVDEENTLRIIESDMDDDLKININDIA